MRWWRGATRLTRAVALMAALAAAATGVEVATGAYAQSGPTNDLFAIGQGSGDTPATVPIQHPPEPPLTATPLGHCGAGSKPEPGVDGRVPAGSAAKSLSCNISLVAHQGTEGGFKVFRYIDTHGHECAYYDTTLMFPLNALNPGGGSVGVAVLDMADPSHPVQTDTLTTPAMLTPHESLNLNPKRGLLAAVAGNLATAPGLVSIYDVHDDCRHPVLDADGPYARYGHESGFSADGKTFYATSTALQSITAIDVTDPKLPHAIWQGNEYSHGMTLSDDGNRAYIADPKGDLLILDMSQIQARKPNPQAREISRLTWNTVSIPQNAIPFTEKGHPYLLEFDEYNQATLSPTGNPDVVGGARIIDISDETKPFVVSNIRLAIDQPAEHKAATAAGDPGTLNPAQGYAAHYCNIPTETNPKIVACSFIASGLRLFDISDLVHPKEIGYYVPPPDPRSENGYMASAYAMSKPAFAPERREIWFTDGTSGFYVLRLDKSVWPDSSTSSGAEGTPRSPAALPKCKSGRTRFLVKVRAPHGAKVRSIKATLGGRRVRVVRRGRARYASVNLGSVRSSAARLVIRVHLVHGKTRTSSRVYRLCKAA